MTTDLPINTEEKTEIAKAEILAEKTGDSKGERWFNGITYGGIGGVLNFVLTIPIAYKAKYGGWAKNFVAAAKKLEKSGLSPHTTEHVLMTTATMQGGNITVIPVKLLEDHKPEIVEKLNNMLGDKSGDASVDKENEQSWGSLVKARILMAWLPVFVSFKAAGKIFGEEKFLEFQDKFSEHVICAPLGQPTHTLGMKKIVENETKLFRVGKIAALDVFASTAAAALLYIGSRFFAAANQRWRAHDLPKQMKQMDDSTMGTAPQQSDIKPAPTQEQGHNTKFNQAATALSPTIMPRTSTFAQNISNQKIISEAFPGVTL